MSRSPFPGMDPYLEPHWLDVHTKLVTYGSDSLNELLPEDLIARSEERVAVEAEDTQAREIEPDVRVFEAVGAGSATALAAEAGVGLAPYRLTAISEPITERYIEILDPSGNRLISVIEFVSPTNKTGKGINAFRRKRDELLAGGVNVVEVDLNRSGDWHELLSPHRCPRAALSPYRATIRVPTEPGVVYLHPISLRQPLPAIKIPLRPRENAVELPLQTLLDRAYQNGRYARTVDYSRNSAPPVEPQDGAWADELLRAAGKR